jgi:hypothetical protein
MEASVYTIPKKEGLGGKQWLFIIIVDIADIE